jgi:hypothetical protein
VRERSSNWRGETMSVVWLRVGMRLTPTNAADLLFDDVATLAV